MVIQESRLKKAGGWKYHELKMDIEKTIKEVESKETPKKGINLKKIKIQGLHSQETIVTPLNYHMKVI